ncbi:uncharacterized protein syt18b isoform X2 [Corythoichthys intestinalis]|uniref:uncharacterized protein syt18b isoform X2 n=1 Tax=Corythoichthys intestinalis TaxID=161448 RepID=UPI0025A526FD|nr:uncharacterized protein syt18b isoform X2 [Corythoichthys intestinalis]
MPYHDEEYPGQPLWQSVMLFCCKGMIEVIMVVLFFCLLVQVLFTKQLEVHLQVLLLVGLVTFCLCLLTGCVLCWWQSGICCEEDKESMTSPESVTLEPPSSVPPSPSPLQYNELDGDTLDYPSTFSSPAAFEERFTSWSFSSQTRSASERKEHPKTFFSLRRLSNPPLYKPIDSSHTSLPSFPKLLSKALQRRCTVTGDSTGRLYTEHCRLSSASPSTPEEPIPLVSLDYGSNASCAPSTPHLNFTMLFSPDRQTLTITILSLRGSSQKLEDVSVRACLQPLHPRYVHASNNGGLTQVTLLNVSSAEELQRSTLKIAVYIGDTHGLTGNKLGELQAECWGRDWDTQREIHFTKEIQSSKRVAKKSATYQDVQMCKGLSCPPQIFILLHFNPHTHQIKVAVLRADNLENLVHTSTAPDYQVVIKLHNGGLMISSRETKGASFAVWNSYFLFDLPPGDIHQLPLMLEFIIMQSHTRSQCKVLGRVVIGAEAADAGRAHWRDVCNLRGEQSRWHTVQTETS